MESSTTFLQESLPSVEIQVTRKIQETLDGINHVFVNPTLLEDTTCNYDGIKFSKRYMDLVTLILVTWFSNYFQGFEGYVRYEIGEYLERNLLFPELDASLTDKRIVLYVILSYSKYQHTQELFGNLLNPAQIQKVLSSVHLKIITHRRPRRLVRRRGYKDKGSARPSHLWIPKSDWSFTEEQNKLEERRELYHQSVTDIVRAVGSRLLVDIAKDERSN